MIDKIVVRPHKYRQFGFSKSQNFYLITEANLIDRFLIEPSAAYEKHQILAYNGESLAEVLNYTEEPANILVICPEHFITSELEKIGRRKLAIMATNSTPTSLLAIKHFLSVMEETNPREQRKMANFFFNTIENAEYLKIINTQYETQANFLHLNDGYEWYEQGGPLAWGQQQIVPSGELSVLPIRHGNFGADNRLQIYGTIVLQGYPILHSGKQLRSREEQAYIYSQLSVLADHPIIATIRDGLITNLETDDEAAKPAQEMLEQLFMIDPHYQFIWEVGFGINTALDLLPGNNAMNEVYGGTNGVLHWGFGLTPFTQFHLDIICPDSIVLTDTDEVLIGLFKSTQQYTKDKQGKISGGIQKLAPVCPCVP
jgi:hypothetical protein